MPIVLPARTTGESFFMSFFNGRLFGRNSDHHLPNSNTSANSEHASSDSSSYSRNHLAEHQRVKQQLERCSRWLSSIPTDEALAMQHTREYRDFMKSFEMLEQAHRHVLALNQSASSSDNEEYMDLEDMNHRRTNGRAAFSILSSLSFLQHMAADDVILRVFEFLECHSLIRATLTCCRFRDLAQRSARQRTHKIATERQLTNVMQLLRAKEQIDGVGNVTPNIMGNLQADTCHVRVPTLLLSRRVLVSNCGDAEFNGVFYCTGSNGNGFVFTKPRYPEQRVLRSEQASRMILPDEVFLDSRLESEVTQPGQLLRCIIAKRFSNEVSSNTF